MGDGKIWPSRRGGQVVASTAKSSTPTSGCPARHGATPVSAGKVTSRDLSRAIVGAWVFPWGRRRIRQCMILTNTAHPFQLFIYLPGSNYLLQYYFFFNSQLLAPECNLISKHSFNKVMPDDLKQKFQCHVLLYEYICIFFVQEMNRVEQLFCELVGNHRRQLSQIPNNCIFSKIHI